MDRSLLVRIFGFSAMLIHGDPLVTDRWYWLQKRLPAVDISPKVLDAGCGNGVFTIGLALRGYEALGLDWGEEGCGEAIKRARICKAEKARFEILDIRRLDEYRQFTGSFEVVICTEVIEHILDDQRLVRALAGCLRRGGRLFLTTPNFHYVPIGIGDKKEARFPACENGSGHVRTGYAKEDLRKLVEMCGLEIKEISFCSGFLSQKITGMMRLVGRIHPLLGWLFILPLRPLPLLFDGFITRLLHWPYYSICMIGRKP